MEDLVLDRLCLLSLILAVVRLGGAAPTQGTTTASPKAACPVGEGFVGKTEQSGLVCTPCMSGKTFSDVVDDYSPCLPCPIVAQCDGSKQRRACTPDSPSVCAECKAGSYISEMAGVCLLCSGCQPDEVPIRPCTDGGSMLCASRSSFNFSAPKSVPTQGFLTPAFNFSTPKSVPTQGSLTPAFSPGSSTQTVTSSSHTPVPSSRRTDIIIGGSVGGVVLLVGCIFVIWYCKCRRATPEPGAPVPEVGPSSNPRTTPGTQETGAPSPALQRTDAVGGARRSRVSGQNNNNPKPTETEV